MTKTTIEVNSIKELIKLIDAEILTDGQKVTDILIALTNHPFVYILHDDKHELITQLERIDILYKQGSELPIFICEMYEPLG